MKTSTVMANGEIVIDFIRTHPLDLMHPIQKALENYGYLRMGLFGEGKIYTLRSVQDDIAKHLAESPAPGVVGYISIDHESGNYEWGVISSEVKSPVPDAAAADSALERELAALGFRNLKDEYEAVGACRKDMVKDGCRNAFSQQFSGLVMHLVRIESDAIKGHSLTTYKRD